MPAFLVFIPHGLCDDKFVHRIRRLTITFQVSRISALLLYQFIWLISYQGFSMFSGYRASHS